MNLIDTWIRWAAPISTSINTLLTLHECCQGWQSRRLQRPDHNLVAPPPGRSPSLPSSPSHQSAVHINKKVHHPLDHNVILLQSSSKFHSPGCGAFTCAATWPSRFLMAQDLWDKRSSHLIVPVSVSPPRFHSDLNITLHAEDRLRILQAENQLAWFTIVGQISSPPVVNTQRLNNTSLWDQVW